MIEKLTPVWDNAKKIGAWLLKTNDEHGHVLNLAIGIFCAFSAVDCLFQGKLAWALLNLLLTAGNLWFYKERTK